MHQDILFGFDLDGTITDTTGVDDKCFRQVLLEKFDFHKEEFNWANCEHVTDWCFVDAFYRQDVGREATEEDREAFNQALLEQYQIRLDESADNFGEVKGAPAFIRWLQEKNIPVAIATGSWEKSALFKLNAINFDIGDIPFGHSNVDYTRHGIMNYAFDEARDKHGKDFKHIVYFGDGIWDVQTCEKMGIPLVGVDCNNRGKLNDSGLKHIIKDYTDKEGILRMVDDLIS